VTRSFRAVCPRYIDLPILVTTRHMYSPRITANLAVLNEGAGHVRLDVDLHLLAAEWTCDQKVVRHSEVATAGWDRTLKLALFADAGRRSLRFSYRNHVS
jgi:hypothetical protein